MVTRLQKKQSPEDSAREEPIVPVPIVPVLTEDLLYPVNKKLAEKDKKSRNEELKRLQFSLTEPFKEIQHRNLDVRLSETGQGFETKLETKLETKSKN